jgi:hypothetical protein
MNKEKLTRLRVETHNHLASNEFSSKSLAPFCVGRYFIALVTCDYRAAVDSASAAGG